MKQFSIIILAISTAFLLYCSQKTKPQKAKYEPPDGKVLVFIGWLFAFPFEVIFGVWLLFFS